VQSRRKTDEVVLYDGVVTALVSRSGRSDRIAVHLDGRRAFDLASAVLDRAGLRAGDPLSVERQRELLEQDAPYRARERALRLLGLRDRSRREIELRLRQAGFEAGVIAETVEWLAGLSYMDDRRFAAAYAAEKRRGGWGPRRIETELAAKGVERRVIAEALAPLEQAETGSGGDVDLALEQTVRRRFAGQFAVDPEAAERRLAGFLARRGYDWDTIGRLARRLRSEAEARPGDEAPSDRSSRGRSEA
jgi:regulatory protein